MAQTTRIVSRTMDRPARPWQAAGMGREMGLFGRRVLTFGVAALGATGFVALGLPLPLLLGPMLACLLAALVGLPLTGAGRLGTAMRSFLGVAVGAAITPQVLVQMPGMAMSLALVPVFVAAIALVGYPLLRRGFGFDPATAWYGAMPGGLQDMLVFGEEAGGDIRALSLIHATRVLVIVTAAPLILHAGWAVDLSQAPGAPLAAVGLGEILLMIGAGILGWLGAQRMGMFGASILGPMILTAALSLAGLITQRPPAAMIQAAQLFIGIAVGVKYAGITLRELRRHVAAGAVHALALAGLSLVMIEVIVALGLAPGLEAFLAFVPGGQAEMVVIAIIAGADLAYVVCHHLLRMILVIVLAPVVAAWARRRQREGG